jgi:hypothetical protein
VHTQHQEDAAMQTAREAAQKREEAAAKAKAQEAAAKAKADAGKKQDTESQQ